MATLNMENLLAAYLDLKAKADALDNMLKMAVLWLPVDGRYDIQVMNEALAELKGTTDD